MRVWLRCISAQLNISLVCCTLALAMAAGPALAGSTPRIREGTPPARLLAPKFAQIVLPATAADLANAMDIPPGDLVSASLGTSDPAGVGVGNTRLGRFFPTQGGTYAILTTGRATSAELPNDAQDTSGVQNGGLRNSQGNDMVQLTLVLRPPAGAQCLGFDFAFFSEEFPEFVGSPFNDFFLAEFGGSSFTIRNDNTVRAPANFAFDPAGNVISINSVFGVSASTQSTYDGGTTLLRAAASVAGLANVTIVLTISDMGDSIYDSAVFLDNFAWSFDAGCATGSRVGASVLSPQSGFITPNETFDLVLFTNGPAVGKSVKVKGVDITPFLSACVSGTRLDTPGNTLRCPGLTGALLQSVFGPGPYKVEVEVDFANGTHQSEEVSYELLTFSTPSELGLDLVVLPPSGRLASTQNFDLIVALGPSYLSGVVSAVGTLDGVDVTQPLINCLLAHPFESLGGGLGVAFRCPLAGRFLAPGAHLFTLSVQFGDATSATSSAAWQVIPNSEP